MMDVSTFNGKAGGASILREEGGHTTISVASGRSDGHQRPAPRAAESTLGGTAGSRHRATSRRRHVVVSEMIVPFTSLSHARSLDPRT